MYQNKQSGFTGLFNLLYTFIGTMYLLFILFFFFIRGDMAGVQSLLDAGTWINETDEKGMTALHHCAGSGNESMLEFLLNAEADADARDWNGNTPLHFAASFGHDGICDRLVSQMPAIDARNIDNRTAYMECVRGCCNTSCTSLFDRANFWRCLRVLESHYSTKHQVRSNATARTRLEAQDGFSFMYDSSGQAAIHTAAAAGDSECLKCLLWLGASVHQQTRKADTHSDDDDDEDNRNGKGSFQKDSPPNECTALHVACMTEMMSLHAVEALLQWGANPNELDSRGMSPMACILMNAGAPPTERKRSIITLVRYGGRFTQPNPESLGDGIQPNSQFSGLLKTIKSSNQKVNLEPLLRQHEIYDEIKINRAKLFWEENGVDDIDLEDPEDWNVEVECHWLNIIGVGEGWIMNPSIVNSEEWIADAGSMRCLLCSKKFTVRFRRHHCRQCGVLCCGECSSKSHIFPQDDDEPEDDFERVMNSNKKKKKKSLSSRSLGKPKRERVCDGCFNKMQTARRIEDRKITRREECNEDTEERLEKARRVYDNETREAMDELRKMQEKTRKLDEATNELGDIATDFSDTAAMLRMHLNTKKKWYKF
eukprot:TRINITY_DN3554_c0_g2_i2.p1 TRINITY_DN3554_c0_g2~~TRINITY_DN3554_c0_g2_i2.p1  ORF type:complete len:597 (-),score=169.99 TRINITY_DN3554_c0_g2_i2:244-2034(-)